MKNKVDKFIENEGLGERNSYTLSKNSLLKLVESCTQDLEDCIQGSGIIINLNCFDEIVVTHNKLLFIDGCFNMVDLYTYDTSFQDIGVNEIRDILALEFKHFEFKISGGSTIELRRKE